MKKYIILESIVIFFLILSVSLSCNKSNHCGECFTPPTEFRLEIHDKTDFSDLIYNGFYNKDSIRIYYYENLVKKNIKIDFFNDSVKKSCTIVSNEIGWKSIEGFKDYFLYLSAGETDSLFINAEMKTENCCTFHPYVDADINGTPLLTDSTSYSYYFVK